MWKVVPPIPKAPAAGAKVNALSNKMSSLAARIQNIEIDIQEIKQEAITAQDVERLREVAALRVEMAGTASWRSGRITASIASSG
jgi:hypothetical protein